MFVPFQDEPITESAIPLVHICVVDKAAIIAFLTQDQGVILDHGRADAPVAVPGKRAGTSRSADFDQFSADFMRAEIAYGTEACDIPTDETAVYPFAAVKIPTSSGFYGVDYGLYAGGTALVQAKGHIVGQGFDIKIFIKIVQSEDEFLAEPFFFRIAQKPASENRGTSCETAIPRPYG